MKLNEIRKLIEEGALSKYKDLYEDLERERERFLRAIDAFARLYGEDREVSVFSVPGRSEISGNHTDHNSGAVIAGSIDRDIIAIASATDGGIIRIKSDGYDEDKLKISDAKSEAGFEKFTSRALIGGMVRAFSDNGFAVGGFDAYMHSDVLSGSGLSSSAAYEVMIGNILNHLYSDGAVSAVDIAKYAQYAENVYFGKPCGLMDQTACAVGGFVYIDFLDPKNPVIEPIDFSLRDAGYTMCIVNTHGSHADLNEDFASVPAEMRSVAKLLGRDVLRGLTEEDIIKNFSNIRRVVGDRAVLRAFHFLRENERVARIRTALLESDTEAFLNEVSESGRSSFEFLQNVYTVKNVKEQGLSIGLALSEGYLYGKRVAMRVHGGGFAGTIQVFVPNEEAEGYVGYMNSVLGDGTAATYNVRGKGAIKLF